jgi:hypothetical protein
VVQKFRTPQSPRSQGVLEDWRTTPVSLNCRTYSSARGHLCRFNIQAGTSLNINGQKTGAKIVSCHEGQSPGGFAGDINVRREIGASREFESANRVGDMGRPTE